MTILSEAEAVDVCGKFPWVTLLGGRVLGYHFNRRSQKQPPGMSLLCLDSLQTASRRGKTDGLCLQEQKGGNGNLRGPEGHQVLATIVHRGPLFTGDRCSQGLLPGPRG